MNEDFGAITILAPKCQQCPKVKSCDHKQMAHLGYIVPQGMQWKEPQSARNRYSLMERRFNYENR